MENLGSFPRGNIPDKNNILNVSWKFQDQKNRGYINLDENSYHQLKNQPKTEVPMERLLVSTFHYLISDCNNCGDEITEQN